MTENIEGHQVIEVKVDKSAVEAEAIAKKEAAEKRVFESEQKIREFEDAKHRAELEQQVRNEVRTSGSGTQGVIHNPPRRTDGHLASEQGFSNSKEMVDFLRENADSDPVAHDAYNRLFARAHNDVNGTEVWQFEGEIKDYLNKKRGGFVRKSRAADSSFEDAQMGASGAE